MRSIKAQIIDTVEAAEAAYAAIAAIPLQSLLPSEQRALLSRLEEIDKKMAAVDRRLLGQLISEVPPRQFGGAS